MMFLPVELAIWYTDSVLPVPGAPWKIAVTPGLRLLRFSSLL